jgi:hypothetical protein
MVCILKVRQFNQDVERGKKEESGEFKQECHTCAYESTHAHAPTKARVEAAWQGRMEEADTA